MWKNKEKNIKGMKLDIGSGNPVEGEVQAGADFVLNDIEPHPGIDLVCDIKDLYKHINPGWCSYIRASHVLEHFGTKEVDEVMIMLHSLLETGGQFEVIVPNFTWHATLVASGRDEEAVTYAFGGQLDQWDYHKTGFTHRILKNKLESSGFNHIEIQDMTSLVCRCAKID